MNELMDKVEALPDGALIDSPAVTDYGTGLTTTDLKALVTRLREAEARVERLTEELNAAVAACGQLDYLEHGIWCTVGVAECDDCEAEGERQTFPPEEAHG